MFGANRDPNRSDWRDNLRGTWDYGDAIPYPPPGQMCGAQGPRIGEDSSACALYVHDVNDHGHVFALGGVVVAKHMRFNRTADDSNPEVPRMYTTPRREHRQRTDAAAVNADAPPLPYRQQQPPPVLEAVQQVLNMLLRDAEAAGHSATRSDDATDMNAPLMHTTRAAAYSEAAHMVRDALDVARQVWESQQTVITTSGTVELDSFELDDQGDRLRSIPLPSRDFGGKLTDADVASSTYPQGTAVAWRVTGIDAVGSTVSQDVYGMLAVQLDQGQPYATVAFGDDTLILPFSALRFASTFADLVAWHEDPLNPGSRVAESEDWDAPIQALTDRLELPTRSPADATLLVQSVRASGLVKLTLNGPEGHKGVDLDMADWGDLDKRMRQLFARISLAQHRAR
jgi:hypothetical protein